MPLQPKFKLMVGVWRARSDFVNNLKFSLIDSLLLFQHQNHAIIEQMYPY